MGVSTLPLTDFGTRANCWATLAVPLHTFEIISTHLPAPMSEISRSLNEETHVRESPPMSSGPCLLWDRSGLVRCKDMKRSSISQTWVLFALSQHPAKKDNSQKANQVHSRMQKWAAACVMLVSFVSALSNRTTLVKARSRPHMVHTLQTHRSNPVGASERALAFPIPSSYPWNLDSPSSPRVSVPGEQRGQECSTSAPKGTRRGRGSCLPFHLVSPIKGKK